MLTSTELLNSLSDVERELAILHKLLVEHFEKTNIEQNCLVYGKNSDRWRDSIIDQMCNVWYEPSNSNLNSLFDDDNQSKFFGGALLVSPEIIEQTTIVNHFKLKFKKIAVEFRKQRTRKEGDQVFCGYSREPSIQQALAISNKSQLSLTKSYKLLTVLNEPITRASWQLTPLKCINVYDMSIKKERLEFFREIEKQGLDDNLIEILHDASNRYAMLRHIKNYNAQALRVNVMRVKMKGYENFRKTFTSPTVLLLNQNFLPITRWIDQITERQRESVYLSDGIQLTQNWYGYNDNRHHLRPRDRSGAME